MRISMNELLGFEKFYSSIINQSLPLKTSYRLAKIAEVVGAETNFYHDKLQNIIQSYSIKDEDGNPKYNESGTQILIQPDFISECNEKLNELNNLEADIDIEKYLLEVDELDNISCTVLDMKSLMNFIK